MAQPRTRPVAAPRRLHLVRTDLPAVVCQPWCEAGDGHPAEFHPADQACCSTPVAVTGLDGEVTVDVVAHPHTPAAVRVTASDPVREVDVTLTVAQARQLVVALGAACELATAQPGVGCA